MIVTYKLNKFIDNSDGITVNYEDEYKTSMDLNVIVGHCLVFSNNQRKNMLSNVR